MSGAMAEPVDPRVEAVANILGPWMEGSYLPATEFEEEVQRVALEIVAVVDRDGGADG